LKKYIPNLNTNIYLCGPEPMMDAVEKQLSNLGVTEEAIVKEAF
jgi:ferredoxin-NADP reductase